MREQVQQKQELEARRKAAIEEMMARELERRVGPPRKRPTPEDPSLHGDWEGKRAKVMEYEHGRRSRRDERDSELYSNNEVFFKSMVHFCIIVCYDINQLFMWRF